MRKRKRIGLIQIDGEMPNLALMKLSAYHKKRGDSVILMRDKTISTRLIQLDKVYISCIYEENKNQALMVQKQFTNAELGGVGVNTIQLPMEIEHLLPDYSLYNCDFSIGFTTRGCIRKCPFCKVPTTEGMIRPNSDIYEFWNRKHTHLVLMDNNILAAPKHFKKVAEQIRTESLSVDFNQGLDIRLLNQDNLNILLSIKVKPYLRFAFDTMEIEPAVLKGLELLKSKKIVAMWYVLVGFNTTIAQDLHRLHILKDYAQKPYVMRYKTVRGIEKYNDLAAWANQQQFFKTMDLQTFIKCRYDRHNLVLNHTKIKKQHTPLENYLN